MRLPRKRRNARANLLPLLDVVFLILVFLVYAMLSMVAHRGMPVSLPPSASALPEQVESLALTIQADGAMWLDKKPVTPANLTEELGALIRTGAGEPVVQVFADASLPYQNLYKVLDILKKAGLKKISLQAMAEN